MHDVTVPRFHPNDERYVLVEWLVPNGATVTVDQPIATVETAKVAEEVLSTHEGVVEWLLPAGAEYLFGQSIARIRALGEDAAPDAGIVDPKPNAPLLSRAAAELAARHNVDIGQLGGLNRSTVRRRDVEAFISAQGSAETEADAVTSQPRPQPPAMSIPWDSLPPGQRSVADAVVASHRDIPVGFTVVKADCEDALRWLTARSSQRFGGLPELVVKAIAAQAEDFPAFFASMPSGCTMRLGAAPNIGVTIDVGQGLQIPVINAADRTSLSEVGDALMRFRLKSLRGALTRDELSGATIVLSLNIDAGVAYAIPMIPLGLTCAVSLGAVFDEVVLADDGKPAARRRVNLGAAYDHRVINGRSASAFLLAVSRALESPGQPTKA
ncbi:2-oxo acid dehydrogenase subunit E2 [Actinomadura meridiana]|uniref:Dihydrolipoamide acetyltransferase component of pyruvate dehydrogenase complex n=1 Tax=Actinomadura meridiana TaxID=559626 RepID=A0ABP8BSW2_9ACTN